MENHLRHAIGVKIVHVKVFNGRAVVEEHPGDKDVQSDGQVSQGPLLYDLHRNDFASIWVLLKQKVIRFQGRPIAESMDCSRREHRAIVTKSGQDSAIGAFV